MMKLKVLVPLVFVACSSAFAQGPTFEVASVRPTPPSRGIAVDFRIRPGGRLEILNCDLNLILQKAFNIKYFQIVEAPAWTRDRQFVIIAKAPGNPTNQQMMEMLQTLLRDRFQLKVHWATRDGHVYSLVAAKNGPKLKVSTASQSYLRTIRNTPPQLPGVSYSYDAQKASMDLLAENLSGMLASPVINHTAIEGEFDFRVDYATNDDPATGPSIFVALQEQLGLKLEGGKGPVQVLVIDHVEEPSPN